MEKQEKLDVYRQMQLMRKFEERAQEMYEAGKIGGFLHLYRRAQCYAMEVESVDGMDVLAVLEVAERSIRCVREEKRPIFVEAVHDDVYA